MKLATFMAVPVIVASSMLAIGTANADENSGLYSGVNVSNNIVHKSGASNHRKTGVGAFVGYKYAPWFATELTYDDYGHFRYPNKHYTRTKTYGLSLIPQLPLGGGVSVFARGGYDYVQSDLHLRHWAPVAGAGISYQPSTTVPVFARVEYDRVFVNHHFKLDSTKLSVGVQF
ncbi:hypothetical protein LMG33818_000466 [Halomonadaceae bacterium LMG 33818]|uniref:outer membrane beta-barrel protein n=1 Tax=Cernens ardua TaxID=3402176 RepID=UPI003EDBBEF3